MQKGVNKKKDLQHSSKHISCHVSIFLVFPQGRDIPNTIFRLFIKNFTYFDLCQFFSHNLIYHIFVLQYSLAPWARLLVILTNIIDQKYPLQHSRNLYYHLQHIIHHIKLLRHEQLYHINLNIKIVLQFKTRWTSQIQMISTPV